MKKLFLGMIVAASLAVSNGFAMETVAGSLQQKASFKYTFIQFDMLINEIKTKLDDAEARIAAIESDHLRMSLCATGLFWGYDRVGDIDECRSISRPCVEPPAISDMERREVVFIFDASGSMNQDYVYPIPTNTCGTEPTEPLPPSCTAPTVPVNDCTLPTEPADPTCVNSAVVPVNDCGAVPTAPAAPDCGIAPTPTVDADCGTAPAAPPPPECLLPILNVAACGTAPIVPAAPDCGTAPAVDTSACIVPTEPAAPDCGVAPTLDTSVCGPVPVNPTETTCIVPAYGTVTETIVIDVWEGITEDIQVPETLEQYEASDKYIDYLTCVSDVEASTDYSDYLAAIVTRDTCIADTTTTYNEDITTYNACTIYQDPALWDPYNALVVDYNVCLADASDAYNIEQATYDACTIYQDPALWDPYNADLATFNSCLVDANTVFTAEMVTYDACTIYQDPVLWDPYNADLVVYDACVVTSNDAYNILAADYNACTVYQDPALWDPYNADVATYDACVADTTTPEWVQYYSDVDDYNTCLIYLDPVLWDPYYVAYDEYTVCVADTTTPEWDQYYIDVADYEACLVYIDPVLWADYNDRLAEWLACEVTYTTTVNEINDLATVTRLEEAKTSVKGSIDATPANVDIGLVSFSGCTNIQSNGFYIQADRDLLKTAVDGIVAEGQTPIAQSMINAFDSMDHTMDSSFMVLVTDGEETCAGDPCTVAASLKTADPGLVVNVIDMSNNASLSCIADYTGGLYTQIGDADGTPLTEIIVRMTRPDLPEFCYAGY